MKHILGMALVAGMMSAPVSAAVVDVVATGVVGPLSYDESNYWSGALAEGVRFVASFTYDTKLGARGNTFNGLLGDTLSGLPVSATLMVGSELRTMASPGQANFDQGNI